MLSRTRSRAGVALRHRPSPARVDRGHSGGEGVKSECRGTRVSFTKGNLEGKGRRLSWGAGLHISTGAVTLHCPMHPARPTFAGEQFKIGTGDQSLDALIGRRRACGYDLGAVPAPLVERRHEDAGDVRGWRASRVPCSRGSRNPQPIDGTTTGRCAGSAFIQSNPQVLYRNPHAVMTSRAQGSMVQIVHKKRTASAVARSRTGRALISARLMTG